jgi:hypothetical protein
MLFHSGHKRHRLFNVEELGSFSDHNIFSFWLALFGRLCPLEVD